MKTLARSFAHHVSRAWLYLFLLHPLFTLAFIISVAHFLSAADALGAWCSLIALLWAMAILLYSTAYYLLGKDHHSAWTAAHLPFALTFWPGCFFSIVALVRVIFRATQNFLS